MNDNKPTHDDDSLVYPPYVDHLQGNIFDELKQHPESLTVVFGHIGYNNIDLDWKDFRESVPGFAKIDNPFEEFHMAVPVVYELLEPHHLLCLAIGHHNFLRFGGQSWMWFFGDQPQKRLHGMTDEQLAGVIHESVGLSRKFGIKCIITNGIADVDHTTSKAARQENHRQRTRFLVSLLEKYHQNFPELRWILINKSDVFLR